MAPLLRPSRRKPPSACAARPLAAAVAACALASCWLWQGAFLLAGRASLRPPPSPAAAPRPAAAASTEEVSLADWTGTEEVYDLRQPGWTSAERPAAKELRVLRGFLTPAEVSDVLAATGTAAFEPEAEGSKNPVQTPVIVLKARGSWVSDSAGPLKAAVSAAVEERLVPYMREVYGDDSLVAADVLVRRYVPEEKAEHALHYDFHAAATCVVDLAPQPESGLFVQPGPDAASRHFVPLREPGDAVVHGWDTLHGVALNPGHERISLIVWAKPSGDAESGQVSWYPAWGAAGDADAAYRLGLQAEERRDRAAAAEWYEKAAEGGHHMAMSRLGRLTGAMAWTRKAAAAGWAEAQVDLGDALQRAGDHPGAAASYEQAAAQRHPAGLHRLGLCHLNGWGVAPSPEAGHNLLQQSAGLKWADAQFVMGQSFAANAEEKHMWLSAASAQGHPGAANSLAIMASMAGRHEEARELLQLAAQRGHPKAMANLAVYLREGVGGPADVAAAEEWAARAAQSGQPR